jgi:hypothetical protein
MMILNKDWNRQQRRVARLARFVEAKRLDDMCLRHSLKTRVHDLFTRTETLFLIGATGAVWSARLHDKSEDEKGHPILELIAAVLIVRRWKDIAGFLKSRWSPR